MSSAHNLKMLGLLLGAMLLLRACAISAPAGPDVQRACLPMKQYSAIDQQVILGELQWLGPKAPALRSAMLDYEALRDANRASCHVAKPLEGGL